MISPLVPARIPELKFRFSNEIPVECAHAAVCAQLCYFESKQAPLKHGFSRGPFGPREQNSSPRTIKILFRTNKMFFSTTFWSGTETLHDDDESQIEYTAFPGSIIILSIFVLSNRRCRIKYSKHLRNSIRSPSLKLSLSVYR